MDKEKKVIRVAVVAGTPVDTEMGVEFVRSRASREGDNHLGPGEEGAAVFEPIYCPVSGSCDEQIRFQYSSQTEKHAVIDRIFSPLIADGVTDFFIYCNSLSGAYDFESYSAEHAVRIYTPLAVYRQLGRTLGSSSGRIGVMAANNLSAHNIEKALMEGDDSIYMIGTGNMAIVSAIEAGLPPGEIVRSCGLEYMVRYMRACGAQALVLGCTHFPYIKEELARICSRPEIGIPVIDPADEMYRALLEAHS